ncbi:BON domain-containing protein [Paraburkholderia sp. BCC1884]|uniref:BON domain-containing protein n=1 Tax=Paraburkholderia sp. BCC1884 TaxID=2562668 RepID=UPI0021B33CC7|nr:BON domain-containing protein [Paraburkholderia sp. BCC1884]
MLARAIGILTATTISIGAIVVAPVTFAQTTPAATDAKTQRQANRKLARDVRKALEKAQLNVDDIRILARSGVVTLDGTVPEGDDVSKVPAIASKVPGVTSIANNVGVREEGH